MKQFTIELDETVCIWLTHISEVTGESIENLIVNGIYHQIANLEDAIEKSFAIQEAAQ